MALTRVLKWIAVLLLSMVFVGLLFVVPFTLSLAEITKPEVMKPLFFAISAAMPQDADANSKLDASIRIECETVDEVQIPVDSTENITIDCNDIRNNVPINEAILDDFFDKMYYANYTCSFIECFKTQEKGEFPSFIFSKPANDFFKDASMKAVLVLIIIGLLIILLGGIRTVANNLIIAGLPFILLIARDRIMQAAATPNLQPFIPLLSSVTDISFMIFGAFFAAGIILLVFSFVFKKRAKKEPKQKQPKPKKKSGKQKA
ncbi:MAG: hypothetical protein V1886_02095 [archaeon]